MKTFPVLVFFYFFLLFSFFPVSDALAAAGSGSEPVLDPDTPETMLNETNEYFNGLIYTYPLLPDEFHAGLGARIAAVEAMGAGAFTEANTIQLISDYSPSLSTYTEEHQHILSNLTNNFSAEAATVGRSYTDSMLQAVQDMNARTDSFYDPANGFPAANSAEAAGAKNLVLTYTDENNTSFDPQIAASHTAVQAAIAELNQALGEYAALNPADTTATNQAAMAAAQARVESATDAYAGAATSSLEYRWDKAELSAAGYRTDTENVFSGYAADIQSHIDGTPLSAMLINQVVGGLATETAGHPYYDPDNPLDWVEAYSRTPGDRNAAAYDVARRIYDDFETDLQGLRGDVGDTAQAIGEGRTQYRLYDQSLDTVSFDEAVRRSGQDFVNNASQTGQLFSHDLKGLAQQYGIDTLGDGNLFLNQADSLKNDFHLNQSNLLGRAQTTLLDQLTVFEGAAKNTSENFKTNLADHSTEMLGRGQDVRDFITDRMEAYRDSTHRNVVNLIDDVVYRSLTDLEAKIEAGQVSSFDFSSLSSPNLENGKFKHFFFDPAVAVGYQFEVLSGPNFRSVSFLPAGADNLFDLYLFGNGSWNFDRTLTAGTDTNGDLLIHILNLASPDQGVPQFMILGIAPESMLNPGDPFAFTAGLSFAGNLIDAEIRMTPLTQDYTPGGGNIPVTVIPEPATLLLLGSGLVVFTVRRRARKRA